MITKDFLTAGNATLTVEVPASFQQQHGCKPHYTFKVRFKRGSGSYRDTFFVSLLTGPDNVFDYQYLGVIDPESGEFRTTYKSCQKPDSIVVLLFRRVVERLWKGEGEKIGAAGFKLHHEGKCGRCGRLLTVPESVESGIGPECARRMGCERNCKPFDFRSRMTTMEERDNARSDDR